MTELAMEGLRNPAASAKGLWNPAFQSSELVGTSNKQNVRLQVTFLPKTDISRKHP